MKRIIVVMLAIVFAIGLVSVMKTKPTPLAQVQVEEESGDEPTQVTLKSHPDDDEERPKDLSDEDELPLVDGKRPTVQGVRDFGLELARKLVARLSPWQTARSPMKLGEQANVQPVPEKELLWKVYGVIDKANAYSETWTAFVTFDGGDIAKPYRLVEFQFMDQDFTKEVTD